MVTGEQRYWCVGAEKCSGSFKVRYALKCLPGNALKYFVPGLGRCSHMGSGLDKAYQASNIQKKTYCPVPYHVDEFSELKAINFISSLLRSRLVEHHCQRGQRSSCRRFKNQWRSRRPTLAKMLSRREHVQLLCPSSVNFKSYLPEILIDGCLRV